MELLGPGIHGSKQDKDKEKFYASVNFLTFSPSETTNLEYFDIFTYTTLVMYVTLVVSGSLSRFGSFSNETGTIHLNVLKNANAIYSRISRYGKSYSK